MIRDLVRTACVIAVMAVAAALLVEMRERLAVIELAVRQAPCPVAYVPFAGLPAASQPEPPGPLTRLGRATMGWADAALQVVR
jgi:hypothetical protein